MKLINSNTATFVAFFTCVGYFAGKTLSFFVGAVGFLCLLYMFAAFFKDE